jgi:hypothetical protein
LRFLGRTDWSAARNSGWDDGNVIQAARAPVQWLECLSERFRWSSWRGFLSIVSSLIWNPCGWWWAKPNKTVLLRRSWEADALCVLRRNYECLV